MKQNYVLKTSLLILTITMNLTVFGQPSHSDSVKISREQQRQCIKWYNETLYKDSIIEVKDKVINVKDSIIENKGREISACNERSEELARENTRKDIKIKRRGRIALGMGLIAIIETTILILF